ncbi:hypothetical protein [Devosia psychrophila]|uniref:Flagellin FlgL n=1 Tax=Devosia psychrophila TaxID=728005 RepID=A0A0F5Q0Q0_9HYPH|nr:hypothetical protein [Devosia psychrophila]KKC34512.1 hypothetical protein WH91_02435 [Devosia psychrophila]SFC57585.1 hypothetical protein SAMN04488059_10745 [Devosia psychrophila]
MIVNKSMFPVQTGFGVISKMQDKFATLQMQLGTGDKASKLSEMGRDLPLSLSVRSRLGSIEGFSANIDTVNLRLSFLDKTMTRFDKMEGEARNAAIPGQYGTGGINMATLPSLSAARFDEIVTMLNEDVAGRYLFGGKNTDKPPLLTTDALLNGEGGKSGYTEVVRQRRIADGVDDGVVAASPGPPVIAPLAPGRLTIDGTTPGTVTLGEDGTAAHPFGFKLSTISTTAASTAVAITTPATVPKTFGIAFTGQPASGDNINVGLKLPDGTETQVKLTATSEVPPPPGTFLIDATPDQTAANYQTALGQALERTAKTDLRAASAFAAANDFFHEDGTAWVPTTSVPGGKPDGLAPNSTNFVQWYTGSQAPAGQSARQSVSAAIDDASRVNYGMQANESGFLGLIRSQAALAISTYPSEAEVRGDLESTRLAAMAQPEGPLRSSALAAYEGKVQASYRLSTGFFDGMATRQQSELSEGQNSEAGSIEIITMDIGIAMKSLENATDRHKTYKSQLDNLLSDVETVSKEDVAMEILALQTRLQASYQTTSMVAKLSLVNFI